MNFAKKKTPKYSFDKKTIKKNKFSKIVQIVFFVLLNTLRIYHCFYYLDLHRNFVVHLKFLDSL